MSFRRAERPPPQPRRTCSTQCYECRCRAGKWRAARFFNKFALSAKRRSGAGLWPARREAFFVGDSRDSAATRFFAREKNEERCRRIRGSVIWRSDCPRANAHGYTLQPHSRLCFALPPSVALTLTALRSALFDGLGGPSYANSLLENAVVAFFKLAKLGAKLLTDRKITTYVVILASHPCDAADCCENQQAATPPSFPASCWRCRPGRRRSCGRCRPASWRRERA